MSAIKMSKLATPQALQSAVAARKPVRLRFGNGLYCIVTATGNAAWRCNYKLDGRNQVATLGHFPIMGLDEARKARMQIRDTVHEGGDPGAEKRVERAERLSAMSNTVETVGRAWVALMGAKKWTPFYTTLVKGRLVKHVFPVLGSKPVHLVTTSDIQKLLVPLGEAYRAQAVHVTQHLSGIFRYARSHRMVELNPVQEIREYLPSRVVGDEQEKSRPHVSTIDDARAVLAAVEATNSGALLLHRLIALTAVRKMEAVEAEWSEVDFAAAVWTIPARRMKGRRGQKKAHVVTLAPQALEVFTAARRLVPAGCPLVFPAANGRALNPTTLNELLIRALAGTRLAGRHTVHGWRSTFSTICNEADPRNYRLIDLALAHKTFGEVEGRYNHASNLGDRRQIACQWADMLMAGAPSAHALVGLEAVRSNVVNLREAS